MFPIFIKFRKITIPVAGRIERVTMFNIELNVNTIVMWALVNNGIDIFVLSGACIQVIDPEDKMNFLELLDKIKSHVNNINENKAV